jgi:hypothetical protein
MRGETQMGRIGSTVKGKGRAVLGAYNRFIFAAEIWSRIGEIRMCLPRLFSSPIGQVLKRARIRELSYYYHL